VRWDWVALNCLRLLSAILLFVQIILGTFDLQMLVRTAPAAKARLPWELIGVTLGSGAFSVLYLAASIGAFWSFIYHRPDFFSGFLAPLLIISLWVFWANMRWGKGLAAWVVRRGRKATDEEIVAAVPNDMLMAMLFASKKGDLDRLLENIDYLVLKLARGLMTPKPRVTTTLRAFLAQHAEGDPVEAFLNYQMQRAMKEAGFQVSEHPVPHKPPVLH
jgi:hypothetical protein